MGWGRDCEDAEIANMTEVYQQALVDLHNKYRNLQALGNISHYAPAVRMAKMRWDPDLAALAQLNIQRCLYKHDSCHNTGKLIDFNTFEYFHSIYFHFI